MKQKSNSYVKHVKGSVFYQNSILNVKMFSNLKNKSIAVKLPDKTSLLHGNIHPQMECQVEQMFQTFFFNLNITRVRNPYTMI